MNKTMDVKEKLVELLKDAQIASVDKCHTYEGCKSCPNDGQGMLCRVPFSVDHLISNGVTVQIPKEEKPPTDLTNKCGSCIYSEVAENVFGKSKCYVRCTNEEHLNSRMYQERPLIEVRQRTAKACKRYAPQPKPPKEGT